MYSSAIVSSTLSTDATRGLVNPKSANANDVVAVPATPPSFGLAVTCHVDGPKTVMENAARRGAMVSSYHISAAPLAPQAHLTGAEWNWISAYKTIIDAARSGKPHPNFVRGGVQRGLGDRHGDAHRVELGGQLVAPKKL